jgi:hypothetical protein
MPRTSSATSGPQPPIHVGVRPRALVLAALAVAATAAASCSKSSSYQVTGPVDLGMTSTMAAYYSDENTTLYEAQTPVPLPVKKPTGSQGAAPANTVYPNAPWLTTADESIEVHYTISNIDSQDHAVWLLVDPWNEFVRWQPGVTVVDDEDTEPNYGYDLEFLVPALSRIQGTLTTDDMQEIAIKLASVENLLGSQQVMQAAMSDGGTVDGYDPTSIANNIFNPQNRSNGGDALYTPWIPPVIAGLTGFDLGIRTSEQANLAIEITVDVQDLNGDRFVPADSTQPQIGVPPTILSPPGAKL